MLFTKKVPMNSQVFPGIQICDKNNLSTRAQRLNNTKIEVISFEPEKMEMKSGAIFVHFVIFIMFIVNPFTIH